MPNYQNGKVYKMVAGGLTYVGSTTRTLAQRKATHKSGFKRWKAGNGYKMSSYQLFESGETVDIVLLEDVPCERKEQLHARERHWLEKLDCVNRYIAGRSNKEYYQDHKDKILERKKKRYEQNRDLISERDKMRYEANRDHILKQKKQYYEANKDLLRQKAPCPVCSKQMRKDSIPKHLRTVHKDD